MFTCCHPALALEAQVALTLHTLGGLTTPEIARAFLVPVPTMAQRLRGRGQNPQRGIPYRVPPADLLPERLRRAAGGDLPDLQRGLRRYRRRHAHPRKSFARKRSACAACWSRCCRITPKRTACWR